MDARGSDLTPSETQVRTAALLLRTMLRNRADRRAYRASPRDQPEPRDDRRVAPSGLSHPHGGIASAALAEGYVAAVDGRGLCLEPHDCVIAELLAGREKDLRFAAALVHASLIDPAVLAERIETVQAHPLALDRTRIWIRSMIR